MAECPGRGARSLRHAVRLRRGDEHADAGVSSGLLRVPVRGRTGRRWFRGVPEWTTGGARSGRPVESCGDRESHLGGVERLNSWSLAGLVQHSLGRPGLSTLTEVLTGTKGY